MKPASADSGATNGSAEGAARPSPGVDPYEADRLAFHTLRLLARPLAAGDASLVHDLYCDADTMLHVRRPFSTTEADGLLRNAIAQQGVKQPRMVLLALVEKSTQASVGLCGIVQVDRRAGRAEAGILLKPAWQGKGLAREAIVELLKRAFDALPVREIRLEYPREHRAMHRVADACGFTPDKVDRGAGRVATRCVRTAVRGAWRPSGSDADQPGEQHVERHPLSRNDGSRCQPAPCDR